jgi:hypothetical protein
MIYYYIAMNLFICYKEFILEEEEKGLWIPDNSYPTTKKKFINTKLIDKFQKHKKSYEEGKLFAVGKSTRGNTPEFISGIYKTLYHSIMGGEGDASEREKLITKILVELDIYEKDFVWGEGLALVEFVNNLLKREK